MEFGDTSTLSKDELDAKMARKNLKHQNNCVSAINSDKFENIKAVIKDEFTDKSKLTVAKKLINNECLTSYQTANIMELLNIDKYKMEFAKFAFGRVIDKNNFQIVKETLRYSQAKKQFESFYQRANPQKPIN